MAISFDTILSTENIATVLPEDELRRIGLRAREGFEQDLTSREGWTEKMTQAMDLALQVAETKTTPWPNASNVKFPLITIGALQFSARAYPALISDSNVVKVKIYGERTEEKTERADRVRRHMNYQILEEDEDWEEEMDRLLVTLPIVGCSFKKTYFDPDKGRNCSVHVLATDFVVDYWAKTVETAARKTHRFHLHDNKVTERKRSGFYLDISLGRPQRHTDLPKEHQDNAQGTIPGLEDPPREILEQHCYLDLDDDGYQEPYIVTVDRSSSKVVRIVKRFEEEAVTFAGDRIAKIVPTEHFTKYGFIPSPDGGFYDLGFGVLLGPLSQSVDTMINQLVDAGTLSNLQSGFLGRGIKIRRGESRFKPGEWKNVNMTGEDIRKNVFPLPVREPSQVLFQLLGLLIEYSERISSVTDIMAGQNPGQNQPATTTMAVLEQGMKMFSGIFKRVHRCMRDEFRKLYRMNQIYLDPRSEYTHEDDTRLIFRADYADPFELKPASDPNMVSDVMKVMQVEAIAARAAQVPGYNRYQVEKRYLEALRIDDIDQIFPDPEGENAIPAPPNVELLKLQQEEDKARTNFMVNMAELILEAAKTEAEITKLEADSMLAIAKAEGEEVGQQLEIYKSQLDNLKDQRQRLVDIMGKLNERERMGGMESAAVH